MNTIPCPLCGYDAPERRCPHCDLQATEPSLIAMPQSPIQAIVDGLRAVPTGLYLLATTRGVKRFLVPPVLLTGFAFALVFWMMLSFVLGIVEAAALEDPSLLEFETEWLQTAAEWLITKGVVIAAAKIGSGFVIAILGFFLAWYMGSIVYEAIAGPFLDEIQGRFEKKWFGNNPRDEIERPTDLPTSRCALYSCIAAVPALFFVVIWWFTGGFLAWFVLLLTPIPFVIMGVIVKDYGTWLAWVVKVEGRTLFVSIKASIVAALVLIPAVLLKFIPVIGPILFALIVGFATSLTLLDIPFSRRQWPLIKRVQFLLHNILSVVAYGIVAALLFVVPLIGPLLMVPAASIGGLWLVCRLDKNSLRPKEARFGRKAGNTATSPAATS